MQPATSLAAGEDRCGRPKNYSRSVRQQEHGSRGGSSWGASKVLLIGFRTAGGTAGSLLWTGLEPAGKQEASFIPSSSVEYCIRFRVCQCSWLRCGGPEKYCLPRGRWTGSRLLGERERQRMRSAVQYQYLLFAFSLRAVAGCSEEK